MDLVVNKQTHPTFRPIPRPSGGVTPTFEDYVAVIDLYNQLLQEYRELDRRTSEREKRYKETKKSIQDWVVYLKRARTRRDQPQPVTPRVLDTSPAPAQTLTPKPAYTPFPSRLGQTAHASVDTSVDSSRRVSAHSTTSTLRITSSQTTQGDLSSDGPQPPHEEDGDEDDVPVVVSSRTLKRKRDGMPAPSARVKKEPNSSPVMYPRTLPRLLRTETSDLDALKKNNVAHASSSSPSPAKLQIDANENHLPDAERTPRAEAQVPQTTTPERHSFGPLQPLSSNTPLMPKNGIIDKHGPKSNDKCERKSAGAIHVLSEDGHDLGRSSKKPRASHDTTPKAPCAGRLNHLLEGTLDSPAKTILSPRIPPSANRSRKQTTPRVTKSANGSGGDTIPDKASNHHTFSSDISPEDEPLRSRPLHRLNINDFRVDPKYNALGYAYSETIRKRDERRCLPGCTKECCGAIRRMAAAGILPDIPRRQGLFDSPIDANISDDDLTLQGYLGPGHAELIRDASAQDKKKWLVDARAKAFADRHGKHRQVFERRATPPGFWRTDMPTTQEEEEDRDEARRMERVRVEERWRDAMRGGGRYIFKDE